MMVLRLTAFLRFSPNLFFFAEMVEIADLVLRWLTCHAQTLTVQTHTLTHTLDAQLSSDMSNDCGV